MTLLVAYVLLRILPVATGKVLSVNQVFTRFLKTYRKIPLLKRKPVMIILFVNDVFGSIMEVVVNGPVD